MTGMQDDQTHAAQNVILNLIYNCVGYLIVSHMTPPDQNVGVVQNIVGQTVLRIIQTCQAAFDVIVFAQELGNCCMQAVRINGCNLFGGFFMAELIPYSYSDHVISPFLLFYEKRIVLFFSSSYLKTGKTASLLLLFFSYEIAVFRQRTSGTFSVRICTFGKQNVEKQVAMLYYVDICVILCKDPVKEMKHGEFQEEKGMLAIERQEQIVSQIRRNGAVRIHELTKQFSVSVETIRRDLLELERQDCLHRVHGGAVGIAVAKQYHRLEERTEENPQKKEELSGYAAGLIREGDVLMVDSGSTAIAFAKMLAEEFERLTVITYSLHVFEILKKKEGFTLYLCAGAYLRDENAFCGQWALQMLEQFHAKTAFLFPSAISLQNGIMDYDQELYHLQRAMMKHADRSVFLADSDKFEKSALLKLADVNEAVTFVTDSGLRKEILELYQENGIEMIRGEQKQ